jgi:hypothetical protein
VEEAGGLFLASQSGDWFFADFSGYHGGDVAAGTEAAAGAGEDDAAHGGVLGEGLKDAGEGVEELGVEGVELLRAVERDSREVVGNAGEDDFGSYGHRVSSFVGTLGVTS